MKRILHSLLFSSFLILVVTAAPVCAARGGGGHGGGGHGGGGHGGGFHGHSGHGHGSHVSFGFGVGFCCGPWYGYGSPYYGWPYYSAYAPYYYDAPAYYVSANEGSAAAEYPVASAPAQQQPHESVWYYCAPLKGYYPYVSQCPEAWQSVPTVPPPGSDNRPRYD